MGFGMEGRERGMRMATFRMEVGIWGMGRIRRVFRVVMVGVVGMEVDTEARMQAGGGSGRQHESALL